MSVSCLQDPLVEDGDARMEYDAAVDEWSAVPEIAPCRLGDRSSSDASCSAVCSTSWIEFGEMWAHFKKMDLSSHMDSIRPTVTHSWTRALTSRIFGHPQLGGKLIPERDRLFAIAQCQLDNGDRFQLKMLSTIYKKLTGTAFDCPRYGHHWETVGFQGSDPSTDLRGCGLLSLLCTLYLVCTPGYRVLAADVYHLSLDHHQNFPFMVMCINITRITLQTLRRGVINRECNMRKSVVDVFNEYFACVVCEFYRLWKTDQRTISHSGNVLKDLERSAVKHHKQLRAGLRTYLTQVRSRDLSAVRRIS